MNITASPNNGTEHSLSFLLKEPIKIDINNNTIDDYNQPEFPTEPDYNNIITGAGCLDCQNRTVDQGNLEFMNDTKDELIAEHLKHGLPEITAFDEKPELLFQATFINSFWNITSTPAMVAAHLKPSTVSFQDYSFNENCPYKLDVRLPTNNNCANLSNKQFLFPPEWSSKPDSAIYHTNLVEMDINFKTCNFYFDAY